MPRGTIRQPAMGPTRRYREPYTAEDDRILYDWVKPIEQAGGRVSGNKIYQQLEAQHPNHTWHSWREHYLKKVRDLPRPVLKPSQLVDSTPEQPRPQSQYDGFTEADTKLLLQNAKSILEVSPDAEDEMWAELADSENKQSAKEWKNYFHTFVRPIYESKLKKKKYERARGSNISNATDNEQKVETGRGIREPKGKRRRTLPDSFGPGGRSTVTDNSNKKGKRRATDFGSRNKSPPPSSSSRIPNIASHHITAAQSNRPLSSMTDRTQSKVSKEQDADDEEQELDDWINSRVRLSHGLLTEEQVLEALRCTTMDAILADRVLEYFKAGRGVPPDVRGVWTAEDDSNLQGTDPEAIAKVEIKHGREDFDARFEHLMESCEELYGRLYLTEGAYTMRPDSWLPW
ncbi:hypothetical protein FQN49_007186 [Arthroderma sp. PD_2]|nr:hypothetical protein FQN49_007186 [Arthroderma sp. PD_2]